MNPFTKWPLFAFLAWIVIGSVRAQDLESFDVPPSEIYYAELIVAGTPASIESINGVSNQFRSTIAVDKKFKGSQIEHGASVPIRLFAPRKIVVKRPEMPLQTSACGEWLHTAWDGAFG